MEMDMHSLISSCATIFGITSNDPEEPSSKRPICWRIGGKQVEVIYSLYINRHIHTYICMYARASFVFSASTVLLKKIDGLRVRFLSVAAAELWWDLLDPLT
ncbi:hypothetical protein Y032_0007g3341 [Ancylostoma ceylanicum]|uniref:Uncharacterized protein n=1 Tax=Ancylostoma ceylanicum TaxID=53326 RepID=A0A016VPI2_9BILA|nr:hypothetical protein Y032_0007g3341 [Ancylostoma ceylanicum]